MRRCILIALGAGLWCLLAATPAAAQPWGMGQYVPTMAQNGLLGPQMALQYQQFQAQQRYQQWRLQRLQQWQQYRQLQTGPPYGKAWGVRGGKPYTGNGQPLNGLPNGRAFQNPANVQNTHGVPPNDRGRTYRGYSGQSRTYRRSGRGGRRRSFRHGGGRGRRR